MIGLQLTLSNHAGPSKSLGKLMHGMGGRSTAPQRRVPPNPQIHRICDYVALNGKGDLANVIEVLDLEIVSLS